MRLVLGGQLDPRGLAVFEEEQQVGAVIARVDHGQHALALVHLQAGGQVNAQHRGLAVLKVRDPALVHLLFVGQKQQLPPVGGLEAQQQPVALLILLLTAHPQGLGGDLLEIALPGEEEGHGIVLHGLTLVELLDLVGIDDLALAGRGVLLVHLPELVRNDGPELPAIVQGGLQLLNLPLQLLGLGGALEDVLAVDVAQLDFRHELRLDLVDAEAHHQVRHHLALQLRIADDGDGLVDVQQDLLQTSQQVQLVLLFRQIKPDPAAHAVHAPGAPLLQNLAHAHDPGVAAHQNVEVAGKGVLQGGELEELLHELARIRAPLQIDGQAQAVQIRLVPHVVDLPDLAGFDQLGHLVQNGLGGGGVGDLEDLDDVLLREIAPAGPKLHAAPACPVDFLHLRPLIEDLTPGGEVRRREGGEQIVVRVLQKGDGGLADLVQIEAADGAGHAGGDAGVVGDQHVGEGGGQQGRLLHAAVVIVGKVHGVLVDVPEELGADGGELRLGVAGGGVGHVPGVDLAEVALGVHKGGQQGLVARGETHHGLIDGGVSVGIQAHGLAHDVGALGPGAGEQAHLVHGVQELAVRGLEAVDLRDGPGDDHRHGVGHEVLLQRLGDGLLQHLGAQAKDIGIVKFLLFGFFFLRHRIILSAGPHKGMARRKNSGWDTPSVIRLAEDAG